MEAAVEICYSTLLERTISSEGEVDFACFMVTAPVPSFGTLIANILVLMRNRVAEFGALF
ncbi:MAG: hypothetical protein LBB43_01805 [Spirochaetaceae bacterium]|jgi:hypothetical protein|nr:hypothetical protein [Spirochaetaceae bacterium]